MARKIRTTKSPEERRAEAEGLHATIAEQVEELRSSEAWTRFLTFAQAFHRYSINNLLLILAQKPEATHVAGYRTWQKLGRQVRKESAESASSAAATCARPSRTSRPARRRSSAV